MKKIITITGMTCAHCKAHVERALDALDGVTAKVDLKKGQATVKVDGPVSDEALAAAVTEAGYKVTSITEKKGLF